MIKKMTKRQQEMVPARGTEGDGVLPRWKARIRIRPATAPKT